MTIQIAVSIFDLNLYLRVHRLSKFVWRDIAFGEILLYMKTYLGAHHKGASNEYPQHIFVKKLSKILSGNLLLL